MKENIFNRLNSDVAALEEKREDIFCALMTRFEEDLTFIDCDECVVGFPNECIDT